MLYISPTNSLNSKLLSQFKKQKLGDTYYYTYLYIGNYLNSLNCNILLL